MRKTEPRKTIYIPYMCDHSHVLQAALEAYGVSAEVLPPPDDESARVGMDLVLGKECAPCMITVGDIIRMSQRPDVDPTQPVILNLNIENNVPQLLRSLQAVRSIEEILERQVQKQ